VGDDNGTLWKITGVFYGTPTLAWASGVAVDSGQKLTGPVLDGTTRNVYVGDATGGMSYVRDTGSTKGSCTIPCLGTRTTGTGTVLTSIVEPPIVDGSDGYVTFFGQSASGARVTQYSMNSATPLTSGEVNVSVGSGTNAIHAGAFNNGFYTAGTGTMYACGNAAGTSPELFPLSFTGGVLSGTAPTGLFALGSSTGQCSPVSEIFNPNQGSGGIDWLFVGVPGTCSTFGGVFSAITTGCIESFDITSGNPTTAVAEYGGTGATVGSSGMTVDNVSASGRASSVYFGTESVSTCTGGSAGGCAVQVSQSGLE